MVLPLGSEVLLRSIGTVSLITAVYAAGMALIQRDGRRFFCYLFLSHSSLVLVGQDAVNELGLTGADAEAYAKSVVMADFEEAGEDDVFKKVRKDFDAKGIAESDHQIRRTMEELMAKAVADIKAGN